MVQALKSAASLSAVITLCACALWSQAAPAAAAPVRPDAWTVSQPYPKNPLRQATISGTAAVAGEARPAELQIECRAPELARLNLRFRSPGLKFNLDPFEGPPGIGQKRKLLQTKLDDQPPSAHFFSGFYVESDTFVFAVALSRADLRRIVSSGAATKPVRIQVSPADGKGEPLIFTFTLPAAYEPARDVAQPCMNAKTEDRKLDPK